MNPIISAAQLANELAGPRVPVLLDVRWQHGGPHGRADYDAGHIPGAVFVDLDADLASPPGDAGRHPLPDIEAFGAAMRRAGVSAGTPVVAYDGGQCWAAARAWWLLRWTGHADVRVLDNGLAAWTGPLETKVPDPAEGDFTPAPGALPLLTADTAADQARSGLLLDARAADRYRGEVEPIDSVAGHIPGAVSAPTSENVDEQGHFLPSEALASRFAALGATPGTTEIGVYCGSGVSAAHQAVAVELAGYTPALYVGSWSEWSRDRARPVATGPERG